jgi:hypothetical protein
MAMLVLLRGIFPGKEINACDRRRKLSSGNGLTRVPRPQAKSGFKQWLKAFATMFRTFGRHARKFLRTVSALDEDNFNPGPEKSSRESPHDSHQPEKALAVC